MLIQITILLNFTRFSLNPSIFSKQEVEAESKLKLKKIYPAVDSSGTPESRNSGEYRSDEKTVTPFQAPASKASEIQNGTRNIFPPPAEGTLPPPRAALRHWIKRLRKRGLALRKI
jgi:hypothetical protein